MRRVNAIQVLNLIREHGPVSRATLARISGLSKPTISVQVNALIERGLAVETGPGDAAAAGGKKPTMIRFNADGGQVLAVEISHTEIRAAAANLAGKVIGRATAAWNPQDTADVVLANTGRLLSSLRSKHSSRGDSVRAICVATPGRVDPERGSVLKADVLGWRKVEISDSLSRQLRVPVLAENDVNLAALGELRHGRARGARNAVLLRLHRGIGCGVIINGDLYRGSHWAAGEIAHFVLGPLRGDEQAGARGHLESAVGLDCVIEHLSLPGVHPERPDEVIPALLDAARQGNTTAGDVLEELVGRMSAAVANLASAYDPDLLILSGGPLARLLPMIAARVVHNVPWPVEILESELGDEAVLLGGIDMALAFVYSEISAQLRFETDEQSSGASAGGRKP